MQHHIIAHILPQSLPALAGSLRPWAGQISLHVISKPGAAPADTGDFARFQLTSADGGKPAGLLNAAAKKAADFQNLIFLCGAESVFPGFMEAVEAALERHPNCAGLEFRSLPLEAEHHIDPVTLKTPTLGGTACLVNRALFLQAGSLDEAFAAAHAWDELSRRLRGLNTELYYVPHATVKAEGRQDDKKERYLADTNSALFTAMKFGGREEIKAARQAYFEQIRTPRPFPNVRRMLLQQYVDGFSTRRVLKKWRGANSQLFQAVHGQPGSGASLRRGASPLSAPVTSGPRFSVVIRTHNRADLLRGALQSVVNQTYQNYEIVVVEDGEPTAKKMVREEFAHLPLTYRATGQAVGRSRAGNLGLEMAAGAYLNFLDDDDYFYPDHLEQMAAQIELHPEADLILGCAVSLFTDGDSADENVREAARYSLVRFDRLDVFTMSQMCQIPLLSVAFKKELFQRYGGLHEGMDAHEDWAMWLKYLAHAKRAHPSRIDIPRATSVFLQPASQQEVERRLQAYRVFDDALFNDQDIRFEVTLADMRGFYEGVLADIRHVKKLGQLDAFLARESNRNP